MEEQGAYPLPNPTGGSHHHQFTTTNSSPSEDFLSHLLLRTPQPHSLEDLLGDSAGSLPQPAGPYTTADIARINAMQYELGEVAGLTQLIPATSAAGDTTIPPSTADDMMQVISSLEVNTAAAGPRQPVPYPVVGFAGPTTTDATGEIEQQVNAVAHACLAQPEPYSAATADRGSNAVEVGLPQQPGGRVSSKRKKGPSRTSAGRSKAPEFSFVESHAGSDQLDPYSHHDIDIKIKPPPGSTKTAEIFRWLKQARDSNYIPSGSVNPTASIYDSIRPIGVRSYVTNMMMPNQYYFYNNSNWEEIDCKAVREHEEHKIGGGLAISSPGAIVGIIRTLRFARDDGKVFFMREYIPTSHWGIDLFFDRKGVYYREVFTTANEVAGVPAPPPRVNVKNKTAPAKHRKRGDNDRVMGREAAVWQHFIKVYDEHPEEEGSEVVYAVCCECHAMLKAGNGHGTTSLSRHRRELHQASTSSSQSQAANLSGGQLS